MTGKKYFWLSRAGSAWIALATVAIAHAAGSVQFKASVDRSEVTLDDSVSLKMTVQADGELQGSEPEFNAPDFDVVNEYRGNFVQSYYENGKFGMRNSQEITKVLKPRKTGTLHITGIHIEANGARETAPDITVNVLGGGAGTPPPRNYGGGGVGLRGAGKHTTGVSVIVRAEVDKHKIYKGEQVIVSYYVYRKVRMFNLQVDKFPTLSGFLREDLEMPVLGQRLDTDQVVLDGVPYLRSLLVRYAAYPLQSGKLTIDPMALKYNYYASAGGGGGDDEDQVFGNFFQTPRAGSGQSDALTIDVMPLPEQGKSPTFTGGVGDFTVTSAVDKYDVRANEAVTLTVKVEGHGNVAAIGEPKAQWPDNVELYDSKGRAKSGAGGVGEKVFEFLLIPRAPGKVVLPALEFSFFDPIKEQYVTRSTEAITLNVGEPAPGSVAPPPSRRALPLSGSPSADQSGANPALGGAKINPLKMPASEGSASGVHGLPLWRWLYWLCIAGFAFLLGLIGFDLLNQGRKAAQARGAVRAREQSRSFASLHAKAKAAREGAGWADVSQAYELVATQIFDALDRKYGVGARSFSRADLRQLLVEERGLDVELWEKIARIFEQVEMVRFAGGAGAIGEGAARSELENWVSEAERAVAAIQAILFKSG